MTRNLRNRPFSDAAYTTKPKSIPGYKLVETPSNDQGSYVDGTTTVTYVYEKETPDPEPDLVNNNRDSKTLPEVIELPNTGVDKTESITIAGVMMLILTIIWGMLFTSKKHKKD